MLLSARPTFEAMKWLDSVKDEENIGELAEKEKSKFKGCELQGKTLGVIGLLGGGLLGGYLVSRFGLRRCLWPLVMSITLPDLVYVYLSYVLPENLWLIGSCVFVEQVGYGLGFTAYTLYLVGFARGERSTSVFSLCTAFQYLGGVMLPGMVSGWMSDNLGYIDFFWWVMILCLVTFAVTAMVHLPDDER